MIDSFDERSLVLYIHKHKGDMMTTIDQQKAELRDRIDRIFSKMSSEAWDNMMKNK